MDGGFVDWSGSRRLEGREIVDGWGVYWDGDEDVGKV